MTARRVFGVVRDSGFRAHRAVFPLLVVAALALMPVTAIADGGDDDIPTGRTSPAQGQYLTAKRAIEAGRYATAIPILEGVIRQDPENADAYNYLAYSHRKLGRLDTALPLYEKALALDPDHRGAHEYLGELYLQKGDLAAAEKQLEKLDSLCFFGCAEYDDLKKAIADYKAGKRDAAAR